MKTKGTTIIVISEFIKQKFGEKSYQKWLSSLSPEAQNIFNNMIIQSEWYPLKIAFIEPTQKVCELFYGGDKIGARELGRFSADYALNGIYKFFIKLGSPEYIMKKASSIMTTYYDAGRVELAESTDQKVVLRLYDFSEMNEIVEERVCGWIGRTVEIMGRKNSKVEITKSLVKMDSFTELTVTWDA